MSFAALLETMALGAVAFFASMVTDPEVVLTSRYVTFAQQFIDTDFLSSAKGLILVSGVIMLVLIAFKNGVKAIVIYWMARFGVEIETYFGSKLLNGFLTLPYKWHLTCNSADLVNAVNWRVFLGRNFFQPCLKIFNSVLMVAIMLTALFVVQPLVSFIVIVVIGSAAVFIYRVVKNQIDKVASAARDYQIAINKETSMAIHGIKDVKITQKENLFVSKFIAKAEPLSLILGIQNFYTQCPVLILESIGFVMICLSVFAMFLWINTSTAYMTATIAILALAAWKALPAVNQILASVTHARQSLPYIASQIKYFNLIEADTGPAQKESAHYQKSDIDEQSDVRAHTTESFDFLKTIKFNNVSFCYEDNTRKVIHDLCFEIKKGETVGIIGTSGAGKSTLVDLLIGLLEPLKGTIQIDDQVLTSGLFPKWLKITGYVPQSPYIYDGTLAENIAFGMDNINIDRSRVRECCTMASMDDFINDLPDNIDSLIGERGVKLSGGQQQRVAIARALYNRPELMIFDEATSSLDTKSEKAIQKTIYSFKGKQTLIIIAHRLTTIEDCDKVIWLEKGRIKMIGKPEEVLGVYNDSDPNALNFVNKSA
jgi:ATP-binding cassette, subfamily B, bacterial PglK